MCFFFSAFSSCLKCYFATSRFELKVRSVQEENKGISFSPELLNQLRQILAAARHNDPHDAPVSKLLL